MANMFGVMNGFDVTMKGGESPETLPPEDGADVMEGEKLADKADGKAPPKGKTVTNADDLTFDKEVGLVEDKAESDIADGYVSDIQGDTVSTGKGYKAYNELVSKGMAVEVDLNPTMNIREMMAGIRNEASVTLKGLDESLVLKEGSGGVSYGSSSKGKRAWDKKQANRPAPKKESIPGLDAHAAGVNASRNARVADATEIIPKKESIPGYDAHAAHFKPKKSSIPGYDAHAAGVNASRNARVADASKTTMDKVKDAASSVGGKIRGIAGTTAGKVGLGLAGGAALGGAGYAGYRALKKEDKCGSMPIKKKGLDTEEE